MDIRFSVIMPTYNPCGSPFKILVVGELAYNPERLYALEQAGHKLYGLWTPSPNLSFSTVGPLPFGNVEDIPHDNWEEAVASIRPDIVYGLLNWGAIGWVYDVVRRLPDIPFAWHYKEGPQLAVSMGNWQELAWLYRHASLRIFLNDTVRQWFEAVFAVKTCAYYDYGWRYAQERLFQGHVLAQVVGV